MSQTKATIFKITKEEIEDVFSDMANSDMANDNLKLTNKQIKIILEYVECDEFLAKDTRRSIESSIGEILNK